MKGCHIAGIQAACARNLSKNVGYSLRSAINAHSPPHAGTTLMCAFDLGVTPHAKYRTCAASPVRAERLSIKTALICSCPLLSSHAWALWCFALASNISGNKAALKDASFKATLHSSMRVSCALCMDSLASQVSEMWGYGRFWHSPPLHPASSAQALRHRHHPGTQRVHLASCRQGFGHLMEAKATVSLPPYTNPMQKLGSLESNQSVSA